MTLIGKQFDIHEVEIFSQISDNICIDFLLITLQSVYLYVTLHLSFLACPFLYTDIQYR